MIVYIAGPMTGYPEHNFPAFHSAAEAWRAAGHTVISPAEMDGPEPDHHKLAKVPWDWYLRRDLALLVTCDAVAMLDGWEDSQGASLERHVASKLNMAIFRPKTIPPPAAEFVSPTRHVA